MVANLLRGMCYPDQDQSMAVLTEMVQTGLYGLYELNELYGGELPNTHNDDVLDYATEQRDNDQLSRAFGEVEVLQRQKHTAEQQLYGLQDEKDRLEGALKKSESELVKVENRATQLQIVLKSMPRQ